MEQTVAALSLTLARSPEYRAVLRGEGVGGVGKPGKLQSHYYFGENCRL